MKRFLILLAIFGLINPVYAFGKYKSQVEAKAACKKWSDKGFKYSYEKTEWTGRYEGYDYGGKAKLMTYEQTNRYCDYESSTNQYLGYEETGVKKGQHYKEYVFENMEIGKKIKKYFKF